MSIPTNLRAPIFATEFDSSRAFQGPALLEYQALIIGGKTAGGSVAQLTLKRATSADEVAGFFGPGSQLHNMAERWFQNNRTTKTFFVALDDAGAGVAATGTVTFVGTATAAGVVYLYIAGRRVVVGIIATDNAATIAGKVVTAVNAITSLPVTAANLSGGVVTFTAKNKGLPGNDIDIRCNYNEGEELPAGVSISKSPMTGGATNPSIADVIAIIGDEWYHIWIGPYTDATNLTAIEDELSDRFGPLRQIDAVYLSSKDDTLGNLSTFGTGRNSPHVSVSEAHDVISTPYEQAAAIAGLAAQEGAIDPARPFQTLELKGIVPAPVTERFTYIERNSLLFDGIATVKVDQAGKVRIERCIMMYQKNEAGAPSIAYLDLNTLLTLMYIRYDWNASIATKYPRAKLADDGVRVGPGQQIMTPKLGKAEALAKFRQWEELGLVENFDQFKNDLVCVRSSTDPNRLEWILPPDLVNQFRVGASTIQFLLQAP